MECKFRTFDAFLSDKKAVSIAEQILSIEDLDWLFEFLETQCNEKELSMSVIELKINHRKVSKIMFSMKSILFSTLQVIDYKLGFYFENYAYYISHGQDCVTLNITNYR